MMQLWRTMAVALGSTVALVALGGGAAHAQSGATEKPLRVKLGGFLPYDSDTKDALGTHFLSYGIGYDWKNVSSFLPGVVEIYADYFDRPKNTIDFGRVQARMLGVGLAVRYNLMEKSTNFHPYAGAGIGLYSAFASQTDTEGAYQSQRRTSLGGKFLAGTQLNNGLFGEFEYNFVPHPSVFGSDVALSGYQLRFGYTFSLWKKHK